MVEGDEGLVVEEIMGGGVSGEEKVDEDGEGREEDSDESKPFDLRFKQHKYNKYDNNNNNSLLYSLISILSSIKIYL